MSTTTIVKTPKLPLPTDGAVKGVGQIPLNHLPKQFRKDANLHLKKQGLPPFKKVRPWFFYISTPWGQNKETGLPNPPVFVLFWVTAADQGGEYKSLKELKGTEGNRVLLEFSEADVVSETYSADDWQQLQWGAQKALGYKVGRSPTAKPKAPKVAKPKQHAWCMGLEVERGKAVKGVCTITFLEGEHAGSSAKVGLDCLGASKEESDQIEVPALTLKKIVKAAPYTPYQSRFGLEDESTLDTLA